MQPDGHGGLDNIGGTALNYAAKEGKIDVIRYLQSKNSSLVHVKDNDGTTALTSACCYADLKTVKLLVEEYGRAGAVR